MEIGKRLEFLLLIEISDVRNQLHTISMESVDANLRSMVSANTWNKVFDSVSLLSDDIKKMFLNEDRKLR